MKKKTSKSLNFVDGLIKEIKQTKFNRGLVSKDEITNHREVDQPLEKYLENYFKEIGINEESIEKRIEKVLYKEFDDGKIKMELKSIFSSKSYADFSILKPYKIAIEYKKGDSGSTLKTGIGQCINHTLSGAYDFAIIIFSDFSDNEKIKKASSNKLEKEIMDKLWNEFNVKIVFATHK